VQWGGRGGVEVLGGGHIGDPDLVGEREAGED